MNLTQAREDLAAALNGAGLKAEDHIPSRFVPPIAIVSADEPWLEPAENFDGTEFRVRLRVLVLAQQASNEVVTDSLDANISKALAAMVDWDVFNVDQASLFSANNATYLGAFIHVGNYITIGGN